LARIYAHLYVIIQSSIGVNIPGLGFLLRRCKEPRNLNFFGEKLYFEPRVASSYGLHIINKPQEPESHEFLNKLFDTCKSDTSFFIEVGANIGIFLLDIARRANVHVVGFEPSAGCITAIEKTMRKNNRGNYSVFKNLVGDEEACMPFDEGRDPQGASVYTSSNTSQCVNQIRLDDVEILKAIPSTTSTVLMIDVEGYEPKVLRGGEELIARLKPLVIFEYNFVSKQYFNIHDIQKILGKSYELFRLRKDAMLDRDVENAWNCVAVPCDSEFGKIFS
jgi:FkbM family methyltransferase